MGPYFLPRRKGSMRWLVALLVSATHSPAPCEASFNGFWVLNQRLSRFAGPAGQELS